ncbi:hypothetical protein HL42_6917 [Trichophyton rubrum]|nr:hypothetical protein HL42_6917 [Trichophyton rubrum]
MLALRLLVVSSVFCDFAFVFRFWGWEDDEVMCCLVIPLTPHGGKGPHLTRHGPKRRNDGSVTSRLEDRCRRPPSARIAFTFCMMKIVAKAHNWRAYGYRRQVAANHRAYPVVDHNRQPIATVGLPLNASRGYGLKQKNSAMFAGGNTYISMCAGLSVD